MAEPTPPLLGRILVVCTGNICRSPYVERRLRQLSAPGLRVTSAGTRAVVGNAIEARVAAALAQLGADVGHFTARQLGADQIAKNDLILTGTRDHLSALAAVAPRAVTKALPLRHAARVLAAAPNSPTHSGREHTARELTSWLMANRWLVRSDRSLDDVVDPFGADDTVTAESIDTMEAALQIIAASLRA